MDDLFDRWAWLYALCRERLFTDHTQLIAGIMNDRFASVRSPTFVELGCGPGFYSIGMAQRFPEWQIVGMDRSSRLLKRARGRAASRAVGNCSFSLGDATSPSDFPGRADFLLASRLLLILPDRLSALHAMHAGLRPGGTLLIAEPLPGWRSTLALQAMKVLGRLGPPHFQPPPPHADPHALGERELSSLVERLEWASAQCWSDRRYHYFLCEKPMEKHVPAEHHTIAAIAPEPLPVRAA